MFPFVIQMGEVVMERELKLRQALQAMGLHDTAYWLSWHIYQSGMALLFGFFIWVFGMIFQLRMFHRNGAFPGSPERPWLLLWWRNIPLNPFRAASASAQTSGSCS